MTVAEFARFVAATGHVTEAEIAPDPADYPGADPALLVPGSLVFRPSAGPVDLRDPLNWWAWVPGASWRSPEGPGSTVAARQDHPVTQVAYADAAAYAAWAGKELPTEAEWEHAARGGLEGAVYAWGDQFAPGGRQMANTWQGQFPWQNLLEDGYAGTSPVGSFPANGCGLFDVTGNVWEWTSDFYALPERPQRPCCAPANPRVTDAAASVAPARSTRAGCSRAARTCARPATACATAPRPASERPSRPRRATSAFAASCGPDGRPRRTRP